jgi:hypothetical protein
MARVLNIMTTKGVPAGAVYIGRANRSFGGLRRSQWHNRFRTPEEGPREAVIAKFRERLLSDAGLMADLHELRNRDLVCWCAPLPCHGDVLLELANRDEA